MITLKVIYYKTTTLIINYSWTNIIFTLSSSKSNYKLIRKTEPLTDIESIRPV